MSVQLCRIVEFHVCVANYVANRGLSAYENPFAVVPLTLLLSVQRLSGLEEDFRDSQIQIVGDLYYQ